MVEIVLILNNISIDKLSEKIRTGEITALARAITLVESKKEEHQTLAHQLIESLLPYTGKAKRIAITGVPGAGKSTFIESFGLFLIEQGLKVAVLAIDPSSSLSGGSILGDKTRMEVLSRNKNAFIRPSATSGNLGGITARTHEALLLCEAAGFDVILVETVGVGQSETLVKDITDFFLFLQVAGAGDDLQGIKRGIMEMADLIFINKSDLISEAIINATKMDLHRSMQFLPGKPLEWKRRILKGSAIENKGISEVWSVINEFYEAANNSGYLDYLRNEQKIKSFDRYVEEIILMKFLKSIKSKRNNEEIFKALENSYSYTVAKDVCDKLNL